MPMGAALLGGATVQTRSGGEWAHVNCALWSSEVHEDNGVMQSVHTARSRSRLMKCSHCGTNGASVGCHAKHCRCNYHFACALDAGCVFMPTKEVFCAEHKYKAHACTDASGDAKARGRKGAASPARKGEGDGAAMAGVVQADIREPLLRFVVAGTAKATTLKGERGHLDCGTSARRSRSASAFTADSMSSVPRGW